MNQRFTSLPREQFITGGILAISTLLAWLIAVSMKMPDGITRIGSAGSPDSMSGNWLTFVAFLFMWVSMMIAMMFPSAAPMILLFNRLVQQRKAQGQAFVPTWIFVAGYLAIWTAFGVVAYLVIWIVQSGSTRISDGYLLQPIRVGQGILLVLAGLYQFSPLKTVCLRHCQSPLGFIARHWREGIAGAFRMGLYHGAYCLGCCWGLMLVLFAVGLMNLAAMGLLTLIIFLEKVSRYGMVLGRIVGVGLVGLGVYLIL
jgi:predicted metal-binding membrane protein